MRLDCPINDPPNIYYYSVIFYCVLNAAKEVASVVNATTTGSFNIKRVLNLPFIEV